MYNDITFAIISSGIVAGVFYAFSTFIMKALGQAPAPEGIAAMQRINITVINPLFMLVFMGTPVVSAYLAIVGIMNFSDPGAGYLVAGSVLHIVGSLLVTIAFNIPRNNALARVTPESDEAAVLWKDYLREWTTWNHVRTTAAAGSAVLLTLALVWGA